MNDAQKGEKTTFQKFKTGFGRKKQELLEKMGKVEEVSVDSEVNSLKSHMFEQDKKLKHVNETFLRYLDALKVLSAAQMNLAEEITNLMNEQDQSLQSVLFKSSATKYLKYMRTIDTERVRVDELLRKSVVDPILQYSKQVSQLEKRFAEEEKRRLDTDRYSREVKQLSEKAHYSDKLPKFEQKLKAAREGYLSLHQEVSKDVQNILQDRTSIIDHLFALVASTQVSFFKFSNQTLEPISGEINASRIDTKRLINYPTVITSEEKSVAFQNVLGPSSSLQNVSNVTTTSAPSISPNNSNNNSYISTSSDEHSEPKLKRGISWSEQVAVRIFEKDSDEENEVEEINNSSSSNNDDGDVDANTLKLVSVPSTYQQAKTNPPATARRELPPRPSSSPNLNSSNNNNNSLRNNSIPSKSSQQPSSLNNNNNNNNIIPPLPFKAVALYDFQGSEKIEMSFKEGDVIFVTRMKGSWWFGENNGKKGLVPSNFLRPIQEQ